jgi:diguanylate cyclase (GGDEF)-like protein
MEHDLFEHEQQVYDYSMNHIVEVLRNGAFFDFKEYITIAKEYGRLLRQLRITTRTADGITIDLHKNNLDLINKVNYDVLTGIYNRLYMEDSLKRIIGSMSRSGGELSVMMVDVDNFKKYNDTYGHSKGDACLKSIAKILAASVSRADDFVARYGGEEFAVILPNTDESGACKIAGNILKRIKKRNIRHEKNEIAGHITISIGITTGNVEHTQSGTDYIERADKALYISKQNGRNMYTYIDFKEERA